MENNNCSKQYIQCSRQTTIHFQNILILTEYRRFQLESSCDYFVFLRVTLVSMIKEKRKDRPKHLQHLSQDDYKMITCTIIKFPS